MLCNELDADPDGWIRIDKVDMERIYRDTQKLKVPVLTQILGTLHDYGYIELVAYAPHRTYQVESYQIRIKDDCWDADKPVFRRSFPQKYRPRKIRTLPTDSVEKI